MKVLYTRSVLRMMVVLSLLFAPTPLLAVDDWNATLASARGQTVYWNAWGGSQQYNAFIDWVRGRVAEKYGVNLQHVQITDTANAVRTVLSEVQADVENGSVDLIWINGENFNAMKRAGLLFGPVTRSLPNFTLVNTAKNPATVNDFGVPTDGLEVPWGLARLNFGYDASRVSNPPRSTIELLEYVRLNPQRITYPAPPDFTGVAFLKQLLLEISQQNTALYAPLTSQESFDQITEPLWVYLDVLHPYLWRDGTDFPANEIALLELLNNNVVDLSMSYNLGAVSAAVARGDLPNSARAMVFDIGTLGNVNFVAIPVNSSAPEAAMVVANFLLSPEAQSRRQHPEIWGDQTVLDLQGLDSGAQRMFAKLPKSVHSVPDIGITLSEPHPSWSVALQEAWVQRYAQ